mgnify:FL=1
MKINPVHKLISLLIIVIMLLSLQTTAQETEEELREKKKKIEQDIRYTNKLLSETRQNKKTTLSRLTLIRNKIRNREQLIATIGSEVNYLKREIANNERTIKRLNLELEELKEEYAKLIYHAYKTKSRYHKLMFVFSADGFDQAYRRLKYLRQYGDYRKKQARLIQAKKEKLNQTIAELKEDKDQKINLLAQKEQERQKLRTEREGKGETIEKLKSQESQLRSSLTHKRQVAKELEDQIQKIIAAQMKETKAEETGSSPEFRLSPEQVELSDNFTKNKGKLPWPTKRGKVSSTFGKHRHAELGVEEINNGITIQTSKNASALAVFNGKVTKVISIGNKKAILIQHGDYFTLYDNLSITKVTPGDEVSTGDIIGTIKTDNSSGETEVNFQIWQAASGKEPDNLNPSGWLLPR